MVTLSNHQQKPQLQPGQASVSSYHLFKLLWWLMNRVGNCPESRFTFQRACDWIKLAWAVNEQQQRLITQVRNELILHSESQSLECCLINLQSPLSAMFECAEEIRLRGAAKLWMCVMRQVITRNGFIFSSVIPWHVINGRKLLRYMVVMWSGRLSKAKW